MISSQINESKRQVVDDLAPCIINTRPTQGNQLSSVNKEAAYLEIRIYGVNAHLG